MQKNDKANIVSQAIFLQTTVVKAESAARAINNFLHENYSPFLDEAEARIIKEAQKVLEKIDSRRIYDRLIESEE
jgi:hypothetical protein